MPLDRRTFVLGSGALASALLGPAAVRAADTPVELQDFVRLDPPLPATPPAGRRIEVIEFFWYECPHCNAFEPVLQRWLTTASADVGFHPVPVGFTPRHLIGQKLFYALQTLGAAERLHGTVYRHLHERERRLDFEWQLAGFAADQGLDRERFLAAVRSPAVAQAAQAATALADAYGVDGVPTFGVHGRFTTSPMQAGSRERCLAVLDWLIGQVRAGA